MRGKLPFDTFDYYYGLGPGRSYLAVAEHYGVTKRAVCKLASKEQWQQQIVEMETRVREKVTKKTEETLEETLERHLMQLKIIQKKALEALRSMPLGTAMEAVRSLDLCMKQERTLLEDPSSGENSVEAIIRKEYENWLEPVPQEEVNDPGEKPGGSEHEEGKIQEGDC